MKYTDRLKFDSLKLEGYLTIPLIIYDKLLYFAIYSISSIKIVFARMGEGREKSDFSAANDRVEQLSAW